MIHYRLTLLCVFAGLLSACAATQPVPANDVVEEEGRVHITWVKPGLYTDIRPATELSVPFRRNVFRNLNEKLEDLAKDMPEGYILKLQVNDLDLAGEVFMNNGVNRGAVNIRIVDRGFTPAIKFDYTLLDQAQQEVTSGQADLRNMSFQFDIRVRNYEQPYAYEKRLLNHWYEEVIETTLSGVTAKN